MGIKMMKEPEHLSCEASLRELGPFSLEMRLNSLQQRWMELGSFQWYLVLGQVEMGTKFNM